MLDTDYGFQYKEQCWKQKPPEKYVPESELTKDTSGKSSARSKHSWWGDNWYIAALLLSSSRCESLAGQLPSRGESSTANACYKDASCWVGLVVDFLSNSLAQRWVSRTWAILFLKGLNPSSKVVNGVSKPANIRVTKVENKLFWCFPQNAQYHDPENNTVLEPKLQWKKW